MIAFAEIGLGALGLAGLFMRPIGALVRRLSGPVADEGSWVRGLAATTSIAMGFFLVAAGALVFIAPTGPWIYVAPIALFLGLLNRWLLGSAAPRGQLLAVLVTEGLVCGLALGIAVGVRLLSALPALP